MSELVTNGNMGLPNITVPNQSTTPTSWTRVGTGGVADFYEGGYSLTFNGSTQSGAVSSVASYAYASGTIECRFKTSANLPSANQTLVAKQGAYVLFVSGNALIAYVWGTGGGGTSTSFTVNDGNWHHAAFVFQSGVTNGSKLFLDGVLVNAFTCSITDQTGLFRIGALSYGEYFNGSLDEVRVWSTALSDATILQNYNKKIDPTTPGLTGYWPLDEGSGTTATNSVTVPISPNFSLSGSPTWTPLTNITLYQHSGLPNTLLQFAYITNNSSSLSQTITFPTAGNYILSFWTSNDSSLFSNTMRLVASVGAIASKTIDYTVNDTWIQYTLPFTLNSGQLTQTLSLQNTASATSQMWVTGVSIVSAPPPCFREGTLISCSLNGLETEVPIERLKEFPYLVKTLKHGFLPIHSIGKSLLHNPGNKDRIKRRLYKLSPLNYPEIYTPLYLTGCHGLLVPSLSDKEIQACHEFYEGKLFVTDGQYRLFACLDERAEPFDTEGDFPIYHVALQSEDTLVNYGIYANGLLVESCSIWSLTEKHKQVELMVPSVPHK